MLKALSLALVLVVSSAFAQNVEIDPIIMSPNQIHSVIGPFPASGSAEEAQDYNLLLKYQQMRTNVDCQKAARDESTDLAVMFGGNGLLSQSEIKRAQSVLFKAWAATGANIWIAKKMYKRPRPYEVTDKIKPCISLENSYAYPSGHTMMARMYARLLGAMYPERAKNFMLRENEYSKNRIIGGVHHPSDVRAGKQLGDALARAMLDAGLLNQ